MDLDDGIGDMDIGGLGGDELDPMMKDQESFAFGDDDQLGINLDSSK